MRRHNYILLIVVVSTLLTACSVHKNTARSRFWQSFTARYNTYYNGQLAYIDGALEKEKGNKDNFTEMLPLHTVGNKQSLTIGKGNFERTVEKMERPSNSTLSRPSPNGRSHVARQHATKNGWDARSITRSCGKRG